MRDYPTITELVEQNMRSRNLDFVELLDTRQRVIARAGTPPQAGPGGAQHAGQRVAEVPVQLAGQTLGLVRFGIRTDALALARERLWRNGLAIGAGVLLAGMLLLALGMAWLSRGFRQLSRPAAALPTATTPPGCRRAACRNSTSWPTPSTAWRRRCRTSSPSCGQPAVPARRARHAVARAS